MKSIGDYFTIYKQSAWDKDAANMIGLYDDDVMIFDMWNRGYQSGLTEWSAIIKNWLGSLGDEKVNVTFELVEIHEGDQVGFGSAVITYQAISTDNSVLRSMKNRITVGFIKKKGTWKVNHQHTSAPIDSELKGILHF